MIYTFIYLYICVCVYMYYVNLSIIKPMTKFVNAYICHLLNGLIQSSYSLHKVLHACMM